MKPKMSELEELTKAKKGYVAPYVWFKCPVSKRIVVDQIYMSWKGPTKGFPPFFMLDCWDMVGGCGGKHRNCDVDVVAVGRYLAVVRGEPEYDEDAARRFELFLIHYGYANLPENP